MLKKKKNVLYHENNGKERLCFVTEICKFQCYLLKYINYTFIQIFQMYTFINLFVFYFAFKYYVILFKYIGTNL